jgi:hypothetical protein
LCITKNNGTKIVVDVQNYCKEAKYETKSVVEVARILTYWESQRLHEQVAAKKRKHEGRTASSAKFFWSDIAASYVIAVTNGPTTEPYVVNQYKFMLDQGSADICPGEQQQLTLPPVQRPLEPVDVRVVIVSLDKFNKTEEELVTERDCYLYALKLPPNPNRSALVSKQIQNLKRVTCGDPGLEQFYHLLSTRNEAFHLAFLRQWTESEDYITGIEEAVREAGKAAGKAAGETAANRECLLRAFRGLRATTSAGAVAAMFSLTKEEMQTALDSAGITHAEDPEDRQYFSA